LAGSITQFFPLPSDGGGRRHSQCACGWKVVERDGVRVVQLDTYGSHDPQDRGTVSQSLQVDEERARELVQILRNAFPTL
jgi:hypothetical protein